MTLSFWLQYYLYSIREFLDSHQSSKWLPKETGVKANPHRILVFSFFLLWKRFVSLKNEKN